MADVEYRVFVGGLAWATDDQALEQAFSTYGDILDSKIVNDRETGRSRGFGFVTFRDEKSMKEAIEGMNGQDLDGRNITVNEAQSRGSGGGGGGGRGGGGGGYRGGGGGGYDQCNGDALPEAEPDVVHPVPSFLISFEAQAPASAPIPEVAREDDELPSGYTNPSYPSYPLVFIHQFIHISVNQNLVSYGLYHGMIQQGKVPRDGPHPTYYRGPDGEYGGYPGDIFDEAGIDPAVWGPDYGRSYGGFGGQFYSAQLVRHWVRHWVCHWVNQNLVNYGLYHGMIQQGLVPRDGPHPTYYRGPDGEYGGYPGSIFDEVGIDPAVWGPDYDYERLYGGFGGQFYNAQFIHHSVNQYLVGYGRYHDSIQRDLASRDGPHPSFYRGPDGEYGGYPGGIFDEAGIDPAVWGPDYRRSYGGFGGQFYSAPGSGAGGNENQNDVDKLGDA